MAAIASTIGGVKISPRSLNPYRDIKRPEYTVDDIERSYRVHKKAGRHTVQTINIEQVVNDA